MLKIDNILSLSQGVKSFQKHFITFISMIQLKTHREKHNFLMLFIEFIHLVDRSLDKHLPTLCQCFKLE